MSDTFDHEADAWDDHMARQYDDESEDNPYHYPVRGVHRKYKPNKRHSASDAFKGFEED